MKRKGDLFKNVCSPDNVRAAILAAMKGKGHYSEVRKIKKDIEKYVAELSEILTKKQFKNAEYEVFEKQSGDKTRVIYKLPFYPDRVVHHCIVQVLLPIWVRLLIRELLAPYPAGEYMTVYGE